MKRTGEIVLSIIGVVLYALCALGGFIGASVLNNEQLMSNLANEMATPQMPASDIMTMFDTASGGIMLFGIISVVSLILGIVAAVMLKGNKKPKAAGIILIITSVLGTIVTVLGVVIPAIFLLIAGIMALARKPKPAPDASPTAESRIDKHN
ncbi:DUF4064 domain-containing protein [Virgibacillus siamensis]|uniref:DUF4064 domain-containing protein n=1 Tax=Virgibacillus siamensis TaxID=480071 RepID=UPI0009859F1C|nr:DUF4064 domain-containing protein [Virgibacillus siamensis]